MKEVKKAILITALMLNALLSQAQDRSKTCAVSESLPHLEFSDKAFIGGRDSIAFWARTGQHGLTGMHSGNLASLSLSNGRPPVLLRIADKDQILLRYKASLTAYTPCDPLVGRILTVDELYASLNDKWAFIHLGIMHEPVRFGGLSIDNGNSTHSGNARELPGYSIEVPWIPLGRFSLEGQYGDYLMTDPRYISHALLHHQALYAGWHVGGGLHLRLGLEDWAMIEGITPDGERKPHGFGNYLRTIVGGKGGRDASQSDRINVLGNHLGRTLVELRYIFDDFSRLTFAKDTPYEDGSGMGWQNFPDGVWTLHWGNPGCRWVNGVLYEYIHTMSQSGSRHDRPATPEEMEKQDPSDPFYGLVRTGGKDDYFNHGEYLSGWTRYGRTVGLPLLTPFAPGADGICMGVENNRVRAHHFGLSGMLWEKVPYKLLATYSLNYGRYDQDEDSRFADGPLKQLSMGFEGQSPMLRTRMGMGQLSCGIYWDRGEMYRDCVTFMLGLSWKI